VGRDAVLNVFGKWTLDREGAEMTSAGRSFQTRAPATESTTSNSRQSDSRNKQIVRGGRPKSLSGQLVGMSATDVNCRRY